MTAYCLSFNTTSLINGSSETVHSAALSMSLRAGLFPVKILQMDLYGLMATSPTNTAAAVALYRHSASTISGGSLLVPTDLREGAGLASATIRYQPLTYNQSSGAFTPGSAVTTTGSSVEIVKLSTDDKKWAPPSELVIAPGSTLRIQAVNPYTSGTSLKVYLSAFEVWFDEERVSRST